MLLVFQDRDYYFNILILHYSFYLLIHTNFIQ
uniref:AMDV2_10 n=1 Tax=uncultured virus TaxID=340016 RepID=B3GAK9_9VIRU|nr:AMDV2_10 [uncultured virus]